jgi:hypothetical protein
LTDRSGHDLVRAKVLAFPTRERYYNLPTFEVLLGLPPQR